MNSEHNGTSIPFDLGNVDIRAAGKGCKMLVGDLDGDGRMELLMVQPIGGIDARYVPYQVQCLTAFDLEGHMLWQRGMPDPEPGGPGADYPAQIYDLDGDGHNEVLCVMNDQFFVLDGKSGNVKEAYDLPAPDAHDCIIIANLSGNEYPSDIILKNRYHKMWAVDRKFELLWEYEGNPGHFPWVYDFDGDGRDEVMAGYDLLNYDGKKLWSCQPLEDHADCIWIAHTDGQKEGVPHIVIGGSVTVMYDWQGVELWRYEDSIESQHIAVGNYRDDLPGCQIAGLDRIIRGDEAGKDGLFLLDQNGQEIWKEDRKSKGWLTIIDTVRQWDENKLDYILAYRRGGGVYPTLYDGWMNPVVTFPVDGYVVHADLLGSGRENIVIYDESNAYLFSSKKQDVSQGASKPLPQTKRLYSSTLYPGGEWL
nr:hypothetical protein [Aureibacillus halotolerans]